MENCGHILIATDIKIKKQIKTDVTTLSVCDNHYCLHCRDSFEAGMIITFPNDEPEFGTIDFDEEYNCVCDKDLGIAIYNGILKAHPDIKQELALKYLKAALNNIRTKQKTEEVKKKRIKRLGLHPYFDKWSLKSVIQYK